MKYVFSDKTGTLTQNVMKLVEASVGGKIFEINEATSFNLLNQEVILVKKPYKRSLRFDVF